MIEESVKLRIFSSFGFATGNDCLWEGRVKLPKEENIDSRCQRIFRMFNRVDKDDEAYLRKLKYKLPSLSVGDIIQITRHGEDMPISYRIDSEGFSLYLPGIGAL